MTFISESERMGMMREELRKLRGAIKQHRDATINRLRVVTGDNPQPLKTDSDLWEAAGLPR